MAEALSRNQEQSGARLLVDGTDGSTDTLKERLQVVRVRILRAWVRNHDQGLLVQIACERLLHQWPISGQSAANQRPISDQSATNQRPISAPANGSFNSSMPKTSGRRTKRDASLACAIAKASATPCQLE